MVEMERKIKGREDRDKKKMRKKEKIEGAEKERRAKR